MRKFNYFRDVFFPLPGCRFSHAISLPRRCATKIKLQCMFKARNGICRGYWMNVKHNINHRKCQQTHLVLFMFHKFCCAPRKKRAVGECFCTRQWTWQLLYWCQQMKFKRHKSPSSGEMNTLHSASHTNGESLYKLNYPSQLLSHDYTTIYCRCIMCDILI